MKNESIIDTNTAITYVDQAIKLYNEAIDEIKTNNNNSDTNKLIGDIDAEIENLQSLKSKINNINNLESVSEE